MISFLRNHNQKRYIIVLSHISQNGYIKKSLGHFRIYCFFISFSYSLLFLYILIYFLSLPPPTVVVAFHYRRRSVTLSFSVPDRLPSLTAYYALSLTVPDRPSSSIIVHHTPSMMEIIKVTLRTSSYRP